MILVIALLCFVASVAAVQTPGGRWTREPDMPAPRSAHAVVSTSLGIYVLAGTGQDGKPIVDVHRFDGRTWSRESAIPGDGLNAAAAAAVGDTIYLIGGFGTTTNMPTAAVHRYDTSTRTWSAAAPMPAPRGGHAAAVIDGRIHVIGGGNSVSTIDDHTVYDPRTNTWTERAKLPRRMGSPAAVVVRGQLYSIGGRSGPADYGDVHIYDASRDAWTAGPAVEPRGTAGAVSVRGAVYLFGGESQKNTVVLGDVLVLAPGARAWATVGQLPTPRSYARAVVFRNAIYVVGGSTHFGASHSSPGSTAVERFEPAPEEKKTRGEALKGG